MGRDYSFHPPFSGRYRQQTSDRGGRVWRKRIAEDRVWTPDVTLVAGDGSDSVVAIVRARDGVGVCWWNRQLVQAVELKYVYYWAARSVFTGCAFRAMRMDELARLRAGGSM